jgi:hypothetical protein
MPTTDSTHGDALAIAYRLRSIEDVLTTLAAWEDTDDALVLPSPIAGQQALHGVWRVHDCLVAGQPTSGHDLRLVERAIRVLEQGAHGRDKDISEALRIHYPPGQPVTAHLDLLLADLACLQPGRPQFADARAERSWNAAPHEGLAGSRRW